MKQGNKRDLRFFYFACFGDFLVEPKACKKKQNRRLRNQNLLLFWLQEASLANFLFFKMTLCKGIKPILHIAS